MVQVVHQSAEINVQQINDLNAFVDGLEKFTMEQEQELEQMLCKVERALQDMTDSTGGKTAKNTKSIQDKFSQVDELLSK